MLVEIFRTVPIPYKTATSGWYQGYGGNIYPYMETLYNYWGITVLPEPLPTSPESIYVWCSMNTNAWPSFSFGYMRFNATDGTFVERFLQSGGGQSLFLSGGVITSVGQRSEPTGAVKGNIWFKSIYLTEIQRIILGSTATTLVFDEPEKVDSWYTTDDIVSVSHFQGAPDGDPNNFGLIAIDDSAPNGGYFLNCQNGTLYVYEWSSGAFIHYLTLPFQPVELALEDPGRVYVLNSNRVLYLLDYVRNEVLGVSKIPPVLTSNLDYFGSFTYDRIYKRILIAEQTPDDPDTGESTSIIRGYRMVPNPTRLTPPIPLKAPRQRRTIPVLVQALDDVNKGVGGYIIDAEVTGSGSLIGFPMSDGQGNSILHVAMEGSASFTGADDWDTTGSPDEDPPHCGLVNITCNARVMGIPPNQFPVSGVDGGGEGGAPAPSGGSNRYIWAWDVRGSITPDAPGSPGGAPVTMDDWKTYFFDIADRVEGEPANDYQAVLLSLRDQGMHVNPVPFEVPDEDWPFYGMSVMIDADGNGVPRGRIWLPTVTPDANGYYTNEIQVIADDPNPSSGETAPNMFSVLESVNASRPWRLAEAYEDEADGRGAFVEAAVTAMHDTDARFGHIQKNPGQNQYNGHAVDALVFKNDDGTTGEIFEIVTDSGELCWRFVDRSEANLGKWYYPA